MKKSVIILLVPFLAACNSKEQKQEVISFEELAGDTGSDTTMVMAQQNENTAYPFQVREFIKTQLSGYDTLTNPSSHPLDRFGYSSSVKLNFKSKNQTATEKTLWYYTFSDTIKTKNAFYNWLDCFGDGCEPVQLNTNLAELNTVPLITLVYDTTIVSVTYACESNQAERKSFQDSLIGKFGKNYQYRIEASCHGPLKWK